LKREADKPDFAPDLPYSSAAKRVVELAMSEARNMQHSYVGTEHVLLGIAAEAKSISAHVLHSFGVTGASARAEVLRVLGHEADTMPPHGEKPQRVSLMLHYSNGAIVAKSFTNAAEASSFLSAM
jgi:ATP-dependent Clp protease ATP-binding subunit ClpA